MKNITTLALAALLGAVTLQSCANDPDPGPGGNTQITFSNGAEAKFTYVRLDTAASNLNQPMTEGQDSVKQTTLSTSHFFAGRSNVVMRETHYLGMNEKDTNYMFQESNGDLYIHNFGLDLVNGEEAQAILNQRIDASWVLAAKMGASSGSTWTAVDTSITLVNLGSLQAMVKDVVTANGDATITINGQQVTAKKFTHVVTANVQLAGEVARTEIELYISTGHGGVVRQVRKVSTYTLSGTTSKGTGADMQMTTYTK